MATQGIVSVVSGGRTLVKAVAGCDGFNAPVLATVVRERSLASAEGVFKAAREVGFGGEDDLVVMDEAKVFRPNDEDPLGPLYRETFADPRFNPRWKNGTAAYVEVVEL